ncbi:MAG: hypothetical protein ACRC6M_03340 [Microcystaceae cyanobacterium]
MILPLSLRPLFFCSLSVLVGVAIAVPVKPVVAQDRGLDWLLAQKAAPIELPGVAEEPELNDLRPLTQSDSLLSPAGGQKLMNEAIQAINSENYTLALDKLQQSRKIFNQLSNFHLQLANSFSGINTKIFEEQRADALKTGQMRDEATYRLALVHRAKNQPELAVPLLIQIIRSQNPTTELGRKSYQQLLELGFVTMPFSETSATPAGAAPATPPTPPAQK